MWAIKEAPGIKALVASAQFNPWDPLALTWTHEDLIGFMFVLLCFAFNF